MTRPVMGSVPRNVAVLIFDDVEVLDFCGPFEVFSACGREKDPRPFSVYTCAAKAGPVLARNQFSVNPRYLLDDCPPPQVLVVPGGWGTRKQMSEPAVLSWIRSAASSAELVLSVCTGALLLAKCGLLDGLKATTHHEAIDRLRATAPSTVVEANARFVDNGKIVTAAGISAGIDASLHVVARLLGAAEARDAAKYMEYDWSR